MEMYRNGHFCPLSFYIEIWWAHFMLDYISQRCVSSNTVSKQVVLKAADAACYVICGWPVNDRRVVR